MKLIMIFISFCFFWTLANGETVKNVGEVPKVLKSNLHRNHFNEGMTGIRSNKTALPCEEIANLFGYIKEKKPLMEDECHTREWSLQGKNVYLAALRREIENGKATLDVGIIERQKTPSLLFRLEKPMELLSSHVDKFDSTIFDLGGLGKAFGIRFSKTGCGAGGSVCADGFLTLFTIDQNKLIQIFNNQMSYYGSFGLDWNKDGTRQHEVVEEIAILKIKGDPKNPMAPPTLIKKLKGKKNKIQTFTFDAKSKVYNTQDPPFLNSIDK
jgi:hypothetical protein